MFFLTFFGLKQDVCAGKSHYALSRQNNINKTMFIWYVFFLNNHARNPVYVFSNATTLCLLLLVTTVLYIHYIAHKH